MTQYIDFLKEYLHTTWIAQFPRFDRGLASMVEFIFGPLTGHNTRYFWVFLVEAALLAIIVHSVRSGTIRGFFRFCFPQGTLTHPSTLLDWQLNFANEIFGREFKVFWRVGMLATAVWVVHGIETMFGPGPHLWQFNSVSLVVLTVLVMIGDDLGYYVFHRAAHTIPWLWAFHKVHHSAEVMTPLVAGRVHPLEVALSEPTRAVFAGFVLVPALYFFTGEPTLITVFGIGAMQLIFGALGNQLLHSHAPISFGPKLDRILVSPLVHQIHHSVEERHFNRNLGGLLSVWDWMFGTLVVPEPGQTLKFGLAEGAPQIHPNLVAAYLLPFWEILPGRQRILDRLTSIWHPQASAGRATVTSSAHVPRAMGPLEPT
jgi:sterol desaturase/sphingolipid hydroxylase (fatty acid hydroxylase superfamily)